LGVRELKAVIDAGPLIHLFEIGGLDFLNNFLSSMSLMQSGLKQLADIVFPKQNYRILRTFGGTQFPHGKSNGLFMRITCPDSMPVSGNVFLFA
jgi:hypothetical protein